MYCMTHPRLLLTCDAVIGGFKVGLEVNATVLDMDEVRVGEAEEAGLAARAQSIHVGQHVCLAPDEVVSRQAATHS